MTGSTSQALPRPPRALVRRDGGTWTLQAVLHRKGLGPVAGVDEAGRGACAGPLVVAACVLRPADAAALAGLADSKLLAAARRCRPGHAPWLRAHRRVPSARPDRSEHGGDRR